MKDHVKNSDALADLSVAQLVEGYKTGRFSPVDAAEAAFDRIDAFDGEVNAFVFQDRENTRQQAEAAAARYASGQPIGPLDGITVSVKDLTPVAGWPCRRGSAALPADVPAPQDAPCVARLREAGAVFVGKTATPDAGSRIVTRSAVHGVTRNPYDLGRTPGGSSGGAAAALSLGMGTLATGTDGAGSIRIPAAFCNVTGLKPSYGRVPAYPPSHFAPHSVTGPMARTVADLIAMTDVMSGADPRDPFAWPIAFDAALAIGSIEGMRVALSVDLGTGRTPEPAVADALRRVADVLSDAGAEVSEVSPQWHVCPAEPFQVFWDTSYAGYIDLYPEAQSARMAPLIHGFAAAGREIDTGRYHKALNDRLAITATSHAFLSVYDAVLCPSVIGPAFDINREAPDNEAADDWSWCPYAYIFNMTGQPSVAVPAGFDAEGLPVGVQMAGAVGSEERLLKIAHAVEQALKTTACTPPQLATIGSG